MRNRERDIYRRERKQKVNIETKRGSTNLHVCIYEGMSVVKRKSAREL